MSSIKISIFIHLLSHLLLRHKDWHLGIRQQFRKVLQIIQIVTTGQLAQGPDDSPPLRRLEHHRCVQIVELPTGQSRGDPRLKYGEKLRTDDARTIFHLDSPCKSNTSGCGGRLGSCQNSEPSGSLESGGKLTSSCWACRGSASEKLNPQGVKMASISPCG